MVLGYHYAVACLGGSYRCDLAKKLYPLAVRLAQLDRLACGDSQLESGNATEDIIGTAVLRCLRRACLCFGGIGGEAIVQLYRLLSAVLVVYG